MSALAYTRRAAALGVLAAAMTAGAVGAQDLETIRIERSPVGQFQALYIADEQGFFAERGIAVDITIGGSPDGALAQLMSGQKDLGVTGAVPLVAAVANGMPVVAVANIQDQTPDVATFGLLVPPDSPIQTIEDLRGKKIGLPGIASPQGTALLITLEKAGIADPANAVELVNLPFDGVLSAIESGSVDAGVPIGLFYTLGVQQGYREFTEVVGNIEQHTPAVFLAATRQWADDNADLLARFIEAIDEAHAYANENPDAVRAVDLEHTQLPEDFVRTRDIAPFITAFNAEHWANLNEDLARFGFISRVPEVEEFIWSGAPLQ